MLARTTPTLAVASSRLGMILDISSLLAGDYTIKCFLDGGPPQETSFTKLAAASCPTSSPMLGIPDDGIPLQVAEIQGPIRSVPALGFARPPRRFSRRCRDDYL